MESEKTSKSKSRIFIRILLCAIVLSIGIIGMVIMTKLKKPPAEVKYEERPLKVEILQAKPEDIQVIINGFGEARPLNIVSIAPEVSGKIVEIHPRLEPGERIAKGEILFRIDSRNYVAAYDDARARVSQSENAISRMKKEYQLEKERLETLKRNRDLAKAEFERLKNLYVKEKIGTRSGVDKAEQGFNSATDMADQLSQQIKIYPIRIKENQASLESARASLAVAKTNLDRCEVVAPFDGRIKEVSLEVGQYVAPGQQVITLSDDSVLELQVPLDTRDAKDWLRFENNDPQENAAWFPKLAQVSCNIRWTEDPEGHIWQGHLHRVVNFSPQTRTLTVALRVNALEAVSNEGLPLVEGMFCSVEIPGKTLYNVFRVPRWAVSFKNTVYLAEENRLKTVQVQVARVQGEETFVSGGIHAEDKVIVTRLADPLENALLEIINPI